MIEGQVYEIRYTNRGLAKKHVGDMDPNEKIIKIRPSLEAREKRVTLYHEMVHALFYENRFYNLNISDDAEEMISDVVAEFIEDNFEERK